MAGQAKEVCPAMVCGIYTYIYMCVRIDVYVLCACDCEQNDIQAPTCNCMGCMPRASQDCRNNMLAC